MESRKGPYGAARPLAQKAKKPIGIFSLRTEDRNAFRTAVIHQFFHFEAHQ
jgi:hypothetical protein